VPVKLVCEDQSSSVWLTPVTEQQLRYNIATCFQKQPENLLSVLSPSGEVLKLSTLAANPMKVLSDSKLELTVIFAEEGFSTFHSLTLQDEQPKKKHKPNPTSEDILTREEKVKRLFLKLVRENNDVMVVDGPQPQIARIPGALSNV